MKKFASILLAGIMITGSIPFTTSIATAETFNNEYIYYLTDSGDAVLSCYYGEDKTEIEIPESVDGHKVTEIGDSCFCNRFKLTKVTIPPSVESIGPDAFRECEELRIVKMPDSVKTIGNSAFKNCDSLYDITLPPNLTAIEYNLFFGTSIKKIEIPDKVKTIESGSFYACDKLESISIPDSVTSIEEFVFGKCTSLSSVKLSKNIDIIDSYTFYEDKQLTSIDIPDKVKEIRMEAFMETGLKEVSIPQNVKKLGVRAFYNCPNIQSFTVDSNNLYFISKDGVLYNKHKDKILYYPAAKAEEKFTVGKKIKTVGYGSFRNSKNLKTVEFKKGVTAIKSHAFEKSGINNVKLPKTVKTIGFRAFYRCNNNMSLNIPVSVTDIGNQAFAENTSLKSVKFKGNSKLKIGWGLFESCTTLKAISIPELKESKGMLCINCTNLKTVKISKHIKTIHYSDFVGCKKLKSITVPKTVKRIQSYAIGYVNAYYDDDDDLVFKKNKKFVIKGYLNSEAHKYAKQNRFTFKKIK